MDELLSLKASIARDPAKLWMAISVALLLVEFFILSEVGVFFLSMGALSTSIALHFHWLNLPTAESQIIAALAFTFGWALILWGRVRMKGDKNYISLVGVRAKVGKKPLKKGKIGNIDVSGTKMRARINPRLELEEIEAG